MTARSLLSAIASIALLLPAGVARGDAEPAAPEGRVDVGVRLDARVESASAVPVDATGSVLEGGLGLHRARGSVEASHDDLAGVAVSATFEAEVSGAVHGAPGLEGVELPGAQGLGLRPRKAFAAARGAGWRAAAGLMTSHWGLGLLANDGDHGFTEGSARFTDPRGGDVVARAMVTAGLTADLVLTLAADRVFDDDTTLEGDVAYQGVLAATWGAPAAPTAGVYLVYRDLTSERGARLQALVIDAAGRWTMPAGEGFGLTLEAEIALIAGSTTLAPSVDYPRHGVLQAGGVVRATFASERLGGVADLVFASGDQNLDDASQNAFKADPNFEQGILLFQRVLAGHSGRAVSTAGDPVLVGQPALDLDRFPTRGSVTNTVAFFPRGFYRPLAGLEVYGGPLVAFGVVPTVDPYNTRLAGGVPRNALDGPASRFLGVELDAGVRYRWAVGSTEFSAGLEGAVLFPGPALQGPTGEGAQPVAGGRLTLSFGL